MEEDIEILEKLKEESLSAAECSLSSYSERKEWKREAQAIENLIKGYKEKDEKLKKELEIKSELIKYVNSFKNYEEYERKIANLAEE